MEWYSILSLVFGFLGGSGGVVSLFTAKAKREGMVTNNMKQIIDEAQEERASLREDKKELAREKKELEDRYEKRIKDLELKTEKLEKRDAIKMRAISSAYRCKLPAEIDDCPVLKTLSEECDKNEGICKINI